MINRKSFGFVAVLGASLLVGTLAKADQVQFITTGSFSGGDTPLSSSYLDAANGISIIFNNSLNNSVNPADLSGKLRHVRHVRDDRPELLGDPRQLHPDDHAD